ncbi:MAG: hypothetical protein ACOX7R_00980 [Acetivibrionales bacterium]
MVSDSSEFFRRFLIFKQEDKGYGMGSDPSGYIKIEVRNGKGRLTASVRNLKEDSKKYNYRLYLLRSEENRVVPVNVDLFPLYQGKGEIEWRFDPADVNGTGNSIDQFNTAVVIMEYIGKTTESVICPLAAYKNKKENWRQQFRNGLYIKKEAEKKGIEESNEKQDVFSKYKGGIESRYVPSETKSPGQKDEEEDKYEVNDNHEETDSDSWFKDGETAETEEEGRIIPEEEGEISPEEERVKPESECVFKNKEAYCAANPANTSLNPCENCYMINQKEYASGQEKTEGDIEKLKLNLDRSFQKYDPFRTRRRDYKWWKLNSPVQLNNILYQCNIRTPLLFNPSVMMSHFKYRHLIIGIYTDRVSGKELIVCGIPGVYRVDERPFGDACRWVQLEGSHPRYGAFGYWLVYIDPKSGKILNYN